MIWFSPLTHKKKSAIILLDLSTAFDTIDHNILLTRLESSFGISDTLFLYSHPTWLIVLNLTILEIILLLLLYLLVYLKVLSLVLFCSASTRLRLVTSFPILVSHIISMLMILSSIFNFPVRLCTQPNCSLILPWLCPLLVHFKSSFPQSFQNWVPACWHPSTTL